MDEEHGPILHRIHLAVTKNDVALSRGTEDDIRHRTEQILTACAPGGGYACGSGNSITNYMAPANYLAMILSSLRMILPSLSIHRRRDQLKIRPFISKPFSVGPRTRLEWINEVIPANKN